MISTKGLELTNFINPDLTWKTVSKGYRSATRRSRKQLDADLPDKGTESPSDTTVSESEKLGVAVLGQRFREKVEHVPIKKRRFTVRSPSPPHNYSPQKKKSQEKVVEDKKQSCKKPNYSKKQLLSPVNAAPTRRRKVKPIIHSEDFSGIEILAAAACNNNISDEVNHEEKSITATATSMPPEEEFVLSEETTIRSSEMDTVLEEGYDKQKNAATDEKMVRFHWDLNVEMEAWESPCETDSQPKQQQVSEACELQKETTITEHVELKVESSSCIDMNEVKCVPTEKALESSGVVSASELSEVKPFINLGVKRAEDENLPKSTLLGEHGDSKLPMPPNAEEEQVESSGRVASEDDTKTKDDKDRNSCRDIETGYDSQYEDGELRESADAPQPYWEEDYEDCVDYGSDTCDDDDGTAVVAFGMQQTDCNEEELKAERVLGSVCDHSAAGDSLRQQKSVELKVKLSGSSDELQRVSELPSPNKVITEGSEGGCVIRKHTAEDGFDGKDSPKASWKELPGVGESLSSETSNRNDSVLVQRSRSSNFDFYAQSDEARADHSSGKERPDQQIHPKSPIGLTNPSANCWDSRHRESPTFRGSFGSDRSRPRNGGYPMHSEGLVLGPPDNYSQRQTMNSFSNGSYRYPIRRRSPLNNNGNNNRGMLPMRDGSPDRRRFRRYSQGIGRGFREYQQRPFNPNDSDEYSHHVPNRMFRRDQNSSPPPPNRGGPGPVYYRRPYKQRSQSRSRSRSPDPWMASRDRNNNNSSRSPDYRFEARMPRMRLPFQKQQNFGPKYEVGFVSPQRQRRFSPQHNNNGNSNNSRWFGDQNGDSFRGRRVPARPFQRFDSVGSSRRMNSDDYYEPPMRPGSRFSDMGGRGRGNGDNGNGGSGGRRFDGSDDERRRPDGGGRYEMYTRVKRCDSDGLRRARFDEEDSFVSRNNNINNNSNNNFNESDNNNNNSNSVGVGGGERRPRSVYMGELVKRKAN